MRSPVKASSFSLATSILEKMGTPFRTSTSSFRFISALPDLSRRGHQLGVQAAARRQVLRRAKGCNLAALHHDDLLERLGLSRAIGDPHHAAVLLLGGRQD